MRVKISIHSGLSGTRSGRPFFIRSAGTVQAPSVKSISSDFACPTSSLRPAVKINNCRAAAVTSVRVAAVPPCPVGVHVPDCDFLERDGLRDLKSLSGPRLPFVKQRIDALRFHLPVFGHILSGFGERLIARGAKAHVTTLAGELIFE